MVMKLPSHLIKLYVLFSHNNSVIWYKFNTRDTTTKLAYGEREEKKNIFFLGRYGRRRKMRCEAEGCSRTSRELRKFSLPRQLVASSPPVTPPINNPIEIFPKKKNPIDIHMARSAIKWFWPAGWSSVQGSAICLAWSLESEAVACWGSARPHLMTSELWKSYCTQIIMPMHKTERLVWSCTAGSSLLSE